MSSTSSQCSYPPYKVSAILSGWNAFFLTDGVGDKLHFARRLQQVFYLCLFQSKSWQFRKWNYKKVIRSSLERFMHNITQWAKHINLPRLLNRNIPCLCQGTLRKHFFCEPLYLCLADSILSPDWLEPASTHLLSYRFTNGISNFDQCGSLMHWIYLVFLILYKSSEDNFQFSLNKMYQFQEFFPALTSSSKTGLTASC